ncbi:CLUMA_CG019080, isoform A [Clunio marinus]|uniref:CLUMA_CG019080, isoform A n=1 Tax=Clunio marinus TaxID=568069 RepID=A0A1J1J034_9DIPT|nr:CLUMA_CG019080, isoform A [Clunio marinus]
MTELKKNGKRSIDNTDKKSNVKKLKPSESLDKTKTNSKPKFDKFSGKQKFENKKFGKGNNKFAKKPQQPATTEKTNWNELKQKKKDLKVQRKKNKTKDLYEIDLKAKKIYEELKMKSTKSNKEQLCQQLHDLMKNADYSKLSLSPDRARIIQMLLKKAPQSIKAEIAEKMIPHITEVALSKYGKFCVSRLMIYCGKDVREKAVNGLLKNIVKLTCHNFSSPLIDAIFLNHATPEQKLFMKQEMYSDLYKNDKSRDVKTLKDTWSGSEMLRNGIINSTKMNLLKIASKNLVDNSLVHSVLLEFIEEVGEQERNEMITAFIPHLAVIASTKQGSRAAVLCYLYSVAKERRAMLKAIKEHVTKLCIHEHGHLLVLEILNSTDDTLNIKKTIIAQIIADIETIVNSEYGKRVIMFIVAPTKEFFHPTTLVELESDLKFGTQKKDLEIRRKELIEGISKELTDAIKKNPNFWLKGGHTARVTFAALQSLSAANNFDLSETFETLCKVICDENWKVNEHESTTQDTPTSTEKAEVNDTGKIKKKRKNPLEIVIDKKDQIMIRGIEDPGLHIAIKKIAKLPNFAEQFVDHLTDELIESWILINRACFVLVEVLEHAEDEVKSKLMAMLAQHKSNLQKQKHSGAKVLLKNL